jgi:alpha-tubulin suppressor-like RCC1 family protein
MATRFNGGIIGVRNSTTGGAYGSATGRFSSNELFLGVKDGTWPEWQAPSFNSLFTWGRNELVGSHPGGNLGLGDTFNRSSPTQVGSSSTWSKLSMARALGAAIKTNGQLWMWGGAAQGVLGQNNTVSHSSPVQVGALTTWSQVEIIRGSLTHNACSALKTDGTLWTWGSSNRGQLGNNSSAAGLYRSSPVQIGSSTDWSQIAGGGYSWAGIKTGGTLWMWGYGNQGNMGQNDTVSRSSPTQVGALTTWSKVAVGGRGGSTYKNCAAIKTDGTLWIWGNGQFGQLGLNNTDSQSSPVQLGSLTTWAQASASGTFCHAIKTDGTLWAWGNNFAGMLGIGLGYGNNRSSPVQVGALTTWSQVSNGSGFCAARKTDGTLWSWGSGGYGRRGSGDTNGVYSPVQIGSRNWSTLSCGYTQMGAITQE